MGRLHVTRFAGPPTDAPTHSGDHWVDTTNKKHYLSAGTATVDDWVLSIESGGSANDNLLIKTALPKLELEDTNAEISDIHGRIKGELSDVGDGTEDFDMIFEAMVNGILTEFMRFNPDGGYLGADDILDVSSFLRIQGGVSSTRIGLQFGNSGTRGIWLSGAALRFVIDGAEMLIVTANAAQFNGFIMGDKAATSTSPQYTRTTDTNSGFSVPGGDKLHSVCGGEEINEWSTIAITNKKQYYSVRATLTDAENISWNLSNQQRSIVVLGGNRVFDNPTNMKDGGEYSMIVKQDATGNRTVTWDSSYKWPGGTPPTLSTGANAIDIIEFECDGTNMYGNLKGANYS